MKDLRKEETIKSLCENCKYRVKDKPISIEFQDGYVYDLPSIQGTTMLHSCSHGLYLYGLPPNNPVTKCTGYEKRKDERP